MVNTEVLSKPMLGPDSILDEDALGLLEETQASVSSSGLAGEEAILRLLLRELFYYSAG